MTGKFVNLKKHILCGILTAAELTLAFVRDFFLMVIPGHKEYKMKKILGLIALLIAVTLCFDTVGTVYAEEKQDQTAKTTGLTKEEMIDRLNFLLKDQIDLRESIPGIEATETDSGTVIKYNGIQLEDMDKNSLLGLLKTVNQQISLKNLENIENIQNIQRQLKNIEQIENINRIQQTLRQQQALPRNTQVHAPPRINTPPQAPKVPRRY